MVHILRTGLREGVNTDRVDFCMFLYLQSRYFVRSGLPD